MANFWQFLGPVLPANRVQHILDLHSKFALGHTMCRSIVDIQSATAEIRRGKKIDRKKKIEETTGQKYNGLSVTMGGHKKCLVSSK